MRVMVRVRGASQLNSEVKLEGCAREPHKRLLPRIGESRWVACALRFKRARWLFVIVVMSAHFGSVAHAERIRLFQNEKYAGANEMLGSDYRNFRASGHLENASSAQVISGRWLLCEGAFYAGSCLWLSRSVPSFQELGFKGGIGSLRSERIPLLRREWGGRNPPPRGALVFFSEANYRGAWVRLKDSVADLREAKIDVKPASIVLQRGVWRVCTERNYGGWCLSMTASTWDLAELFTTEIKSAERLQ